MTDMTLTDRPVQDLRRGEPQRMNGLALAAFVVVFFASVVGLVLGHVALSRIERTRERGRGLALAAVILGWIGTVGFVLVVAVVVAGSAIFRIY